MKKPKSSSELRSPESTAASDSVVVGTGVVSTVGTVVGYSVVLAAPADFLRPRPASQDRLGAAAGLPAHDFEIGRAHV